jgi:nitronate monooxygenase
MVLIDKIRPRIIQGGMGIGVSNWRLAKVVSRCGQLGVVSGVGIDIVIHRRLQLGDIGGHIRRALSNFPIPEIAERVLSKYFKPEQEGARRPFRLAPELRLDNQGELNELSVCANFTEVWLAKENHEGIVGINLLEKIQMAHLPSLYGAMLAGVDFVLMGAGIPLHIPGALDRLSQHETASYKVSVDGEGPLTEQYSIFDPKEFSSTQLPELKRPNFLPIISSATLGELMITKANGAVNGFIVEGHIAGGHNAPPRGKTKLNEAGEPIYGSRDETDIAKIRDLGLPFWLAGGFSTPEKVVEAVEEGATGVQTGSIFALSQDSALTPQIKKQAIENFFAGESEVLTDPNASPSGFPFKVAQLEGTLSDESVYTARPRICDIQRLRKPYVTPEGTLGYRCPSEPISSYLKKGGKEEDTEGRKCLCNALLADIGLGQVKNGGRMELPLVTLGKDINFLRRLLSGPGETYTAAQAVEFLMSLIHEPALV